MGKQILYDELWSLIEPLLPPPKPRRFRNPGRKRVPNRSALTGILFVLQSGIRWKQLPLEMGCGSGISCWRRLHDWQEAGVWEQLHVLLVTNSAWRIASIFTRHCQFFLGAGGGCRSKTGPNSTDRSRPGSKHHLATDANDTPLAIILTSANRNDITQLLPLIAAIPSIAGRRGRPLSKPQRVYADRGYDQVSQAVARGGNPHLHCPPRQNAWLRTRQNPLGSRAHTSLDA
jgi:transposase